MLRDASIVCLSSIDWTFNRHNPQERALALAKDGSRVLFVENTGVRRAALRDAPRLWTRFQNWRRSHGHPTSAADAVDVLSPLLLPFPYWRTAVSLNAPFLIRSVREWL